MKVSARCLNLKHWQILRRELISAAVHFNVKSSDEGRIHCAYALIWIKDRIFYLQHLHLHAAVERSYIHTRVLSENTTSTWNRVGIYDDYSETESTFPSACRLRCRPTRKPSSVSKPTTRTWWTCRCCCPIAGRPSRLSSWSRNGAGYGRKWRPSKSGTVPSVNYDVCASLNSYTLSTRKFWKGRRWSESVSCVEIMLKTLEENVDSVKNTVKDSNSWTM